MFNYTVVYYCNKNKYHFFLIFSFSFNTEYDCMKKSSKVLPSMAKNVVSMVRYNSDKIATK